MKSKINNLAIIAAVDFQLLLLSEKDRVIGGTSSVIRNIINYLDAEHIFLFGITHEKRLLKTEIEISEKVTFIPIVYVSQKSRIPSRISMFFKSRNINSFLKKYNIESVYSHSIEISYWIKASNQVVQHMHGANNAISQASFKNLRISAFIKLWDSIRKKTLTKAKKIIAIDNDCVQLANQYNTSENIIEIPNFVDTSVFFPDKTECKYIVPYKDKKIALFVGRVEEVKGLELFVDVIEELNTQNNDWIGLIVGKGTYEKTLKEYISHKNVEKLIQFTGPIYSQNELRKIYSQVNILLLTSHSEGIPMTILESLACNTPVLATEVGGIKSLKQEGIQCYTIQERNPLKFANTIIDINTANHHPSQVEFPFSANKAAVLINEILNSVKRRKRILAPVSLPPPFYGSNISSENIVTSKLINKEFDLDVYKISYNKNSQNVGQLELKKIFLIIKNFWSIFLKSFSTYDLVYYVPAVKGFAFYRDFLLLLPLKLSNKNILIHLRGNGIKAEANKNRLNQFFYKLFFKGTEVICLSERLIDDISEVHKGKIHIVNNAIKPVEYSSIKRKNKIPVILFLSNLRETKGVFNLLEACAILKNRKIEFRLRLVGEPRGNNMSEIMNSIHENNLDMDILTIAPAFGKEKELAYQDADIFAFPTYFETWGLVINEAMNAGLPVVSTNVGSIPLIIDDGETGFIVEPKDSEALAEKIEILLLDENLRNKMGKKGQEKFYKNYTLDVLEKNMIDVFNKTMN